jgi:monoamine oxidase
VTGACAYLTRVPTRCDVIVVGAGAAGLAAASWWSPGRIRTRIVVAWVAGPSAEQIDARSRASLVGTIFFAGEATSAHYAGTVEGALETGHAAARRALRALGS